MKTFDVLYYKSDNGGRGPGKVFSHQYEETWEKIDMYCPNCGKQDVWHENSPGDYYVGEGYLCTDCKHVWTIQGPHEIHPSHEQDIQRITAITRSE